MRVFVTGASGFVGSAVVAELLAHGHEVLGLARSDASAGELEAAGVRVHRGDLTDLESLRAGAEATDGVAHLGYIHDFSDMATSGRVDVAAVELFGEVLAGTGKPLVVTSGTATLPAGTLGNEDTEPDRAGAGAHRIAAEDATLALVERGVRASVVRLSPTVHGDGDQGFVAMLARIARERGVSGHVGDGANRWPAVHRLDAARLYRLALESAPAGSVLHGVAEEGIPTREIAAAIGEQLGVPVATAEASDFGWLGGFFSRDAPASSARTRDLLGWEPTGPTLLADLEAGVYTQ